MREIVRLLLDWYATNKRDLPWRRTDDPAALLVSEVMLQQTRVAAVLPYYKRFMRRFPTLDALAEAEEHEVLAEWQGLGYYRRARNLHRTARIVRESGLPSDARSLSRLPGVGPYTAAALASRLHGEPVAVVDGNVARVISRMFGIFGVPEKEPARSQIADSAQRLMDARDGSPGDFNQALMELGALVCVPGEPRCADCPLQATCVARHDHLTDRLPERQPGRAPVRLDHVCAVCLRGGRALVRQIPPGGWWEGMWEFPRVTREDGEAVVAAAARAAADAGVTVSEGHPAKPVRHTVTHHLIVLHPVLYSAADGDSNAARWVALTDLATIPMPAPQRKVAEQVADRVTVDTARHPSTSSG